MRRIVLLLTAAALGCGGSGGNTEDQVIDPPAATKYEGPLIDSHVHIVNYRSLRTSEGINYRVDARDGATVRTVGQYVAALDRNNIKCVLGFHAISFDARQAELLQHAQRLRTLHPTRFVLLGEIFSSNPLDWFDAALIDPVIDASLFRGFGEIQFLNEPLGTGSGPSVHPSDSRLLPIYDKMGARQLRIMGHPASQQGVSVALARNRQVTWLMHGPQIHRGWTAMSDLESYLADNPNLYYTVDMSESLPEFLTITKFERGATNSAQFVQAMGQNFDTYLTRMVDVWKPIIERNPERFMWGTDMALPTWHWEPEVLDNMVKLTRAFVAKLSSPAAENFAYKNAERVIGGCN